MTTVSFFTPRQLSAAQYVLALHQAEDRVAVLVRNRIRAQTMQRILLAEDIASPRFQEWLKDQNDAGADVFLGMNPLRANSFARTKESVREIRHVYLVSTKTRQRRSARYARMATCPLPISSWIPRRKRTS